jgi:hypothetical protein
VTKEPQGLGFFEKYLTIWVLLCIGAGIALGKAAPGAARLLDGMTIRVGDAPVVSVPIAVCLFFMMYPIMVKIDFREVLWAGRSVKPVSLTLVVNWAVKPFTMYAISLFFLGTLFLRFIGPEALDHVKMPYGMDLPVGATYGEGSVVLVDGVKALEVPLWRSYLAGCILLGIAPCTAMVLVWGFLARGNDGHTLVMVAINSLTMLFLYGPLAGAPAVHFDLRGVTARRRIRHPAMDRVGEGRRVVSREVPPPLDADHDHGAPCDARAPVFLQRRRNPVESTDDPMDSDTAIHPDDAHFRAHLRRGAGAATRIPRRGAVGDDRGVEPFRGGDRHIGDALRSVLGSGACNGRRSAHRSAGDAHAGEDLPSDDGMVRGAGSSERKELRSQVVPGVLSLTPRAAIR